MACLTIRYPLYKTILLIDTEDICFCKRLAYHSATCGTIVCIGAIVYVGVAGVRMVPFTCGNIDTSDPVGSCRTGEIRIFA